MMNTIADLKLEILLSNSSILFSDCSKFLHNMWKCEIKKFNLLNTDFIENFERKVKNGTYTFSMAFNSSYDNLFPRPEHIQCARRKLEMKSSNMTLSWFIYSLCYSISSKLKEHNIEFIFLEGFKRINDFEYEIVLVNN